MYQIKVVYVCIIIGNLWFSLNHGLHILNNARIFNKWLLAGKLFCRIHDMSKELYDNSDNENITFFYFNLKLIMLSCEVSEGFAFQVFNSDRHNRKISMIEVLVIMIL